MNSTPYMVSALASMGLSIIVYVTGLILSLIWWRRSPKCASLVLAGCVILLATSLIQPVLTQVMVRNQGASSVAQSLSMMSLVFSLFRAAGVGLLIAAAFVDRPLVPTAGFDPLPPRNFPS